MKLQKSVADAQHSETIAIPGEEYEISKYTGLIPAEVNFDMLRKQYINLLYEDMSRSPDWKNSALNVLGQIVSSRFLEEQGKHEVLQKFVNTLEQKEIEFHVLGGYVRDVSISAAKGIATKFQDIDIVAACSPFILAAEVELFGRSTNAKISRTALGGYTLEYKSIKIDIWALESSYFLKTNNQELTIDNLIRTADFSINAIAIKVSSQGGFEIVDGGHLDSISKNYMCPIHNRLALPIAQVGRMISISLKMQIPLSNSSILIIRGICGYRRNLAQVKENIARYAPPKIKQYILDELNKILSYETTYFSNCIGVFQGGGVKASAFIGAVEAAYLCGIRFSALAGTSAGAIIAAFVATGASPKNICTADSKVKCNTPT